MRVCVRACSVRARAGVQVRLRGYEMHSARPRTTLALFRAPVIALTSHSIRSTTPPGAEASARTSQRPLQPSRSVTKRLLPSKRHGLAS